MEEKQDHIKKLFIRLAAGTCTPEERRQILGYLRHNPSPEAIPSVEELQPDGSWPEMPAWAAEAVLTSILYRSGAIRRIKPFWKRTWVRAAAVIVPAIAIASLIALQYSPKNALQHYENGTRTVQTIELEDGTIIKLNQQARLSVNLKNSREVWLNGEAFFTVEQQASRPFVVHAGGKLDVTVLGTSFNVNTKEEKTQVVLNSGSVKVGSARQSIILRPGEMADYDAATGKLSAQPADTLRYTSWKYDLIAFREQSLKTVMRQLGEQYGYEAVFDHTGAEDLLFTGYLPSNDLQQALTTLEQAFSLKIHLQNNQIHVNK
ncbi:FecR family protein [Chitinophaga cymbidii]|uniref:Anti-sigma factor n=1 Tax=Chitinophaga cymbidii TaxID=1096750 RepID=A0A512RP28_9BACT|nr:FecR domain-containing protein [Chitinophaga cymbidii]GEP97453.1 hypothetical protein CCY01nite_37130 [Chitinophaga cymbidii]